MGGAWTAIIYLVCANWVDDMHVREVQLKESEIKARIAESKAYAKIAGGQ